MSKGNLKLFKTIKQLDIQKPDEYQEIPGILGLSLDGEKQVEVPSRPGYVYVRLRDDLSEIVQAYNDQVSLVYGLPVTIIRDKKDKSRWRVKGRDIGRYQNWGSTPYLPRHGAQHSFDPNSPGGDPVWVWGRQMMPLAVVPSGTNGSMSVVIQNGIYYQNKMWHYVGGTGTADFTSYKPTGSNARLVLVYLDSDGNPQVEPGDYFAPNLTGSSQIFPYIPDLPDTSAIPLAAVRIVSGTNRISWTNIYDLRPWIVGDGFIPTGSAISLAGVPDGRVLYAKDEEVETTNRIWVDDTSKTLVIGGNDAGDPIENLQQYNALTLLSDSSFDFDNLLLIYFSDSSNPILKFARTRGTRSAPGMVDQGDNLGEINFFSYSTYGGGEWTSPFIRMYGYATEDHSPSTRGSGLTFQVTTTGTNQPRRALTLLDKYAKFDGDIHVPQGYGLYLGGTFTEYVDFYAPDYNVSGTWRLIENTPPNLVFQRYNGTTWVDYFYVASGTTSGASQKQQALFTVSGDLTVSSNPLRIPFYMGRSVTIDGVYLIVETAPVGASIIVDVNKNGTTIFTNQSNRPQIASGNTTGNTTTIDVSTVSDGDYLTMDIDQIGSTTPGANLTVVVVYH